nr:hypothetical protein [Gammaproteobacteria bacterium]NIR95452.1 hypothetical protein [Gammaproteobacteria bacterium]NIW45597.1 hypothetical protein [Gammaproteobacteria bacterium]NIX56813.1 hypothetical protein [candidate division Zixibacteria bacterium]
MRISLQGKSIYTYLAGALLVLAVCSTVLISWNNSAEENSASRVIHMILHTSHQSVSRWEERQREIVETWALMPEIRHAATELARASHGSVQALFSHPLQDQLRGWLEPYYRSQGYLGYFIVNRDYLNIASMRNENLARKNLLAPSLETYLADAFRTGQSFVTVP